MGRVGQRGEAAVEWTGMVVVMALLAAALTAWMTTALRPPDRPPDVIGAVAEPLSGVSDGIGSVGTALPQLARMAAHESPGRRALRWLADRTLPAAVLVRDMGAAYGAGYLGRLRERLERYITDPVGEVGGLEPAELEFPGVLEALAGDLGVDPDALRAYVRRIRAMPSRRDAAVAVAGDAGVVAADVTAEVGEILLKRLILRGIAGRGGSGGGGR